MCLAKVLVLTDDTQMASKNSATTASVLQRVGRADNDCSSPSVRRTRVDKARARRPTTINRRQADGRATKEREAMAERRARVEISTAWSWFDMAGRVQGCLASISTTVKVARVYREHVMKHFALHLHHPSVTITLFSSHVRKSFTSSSSASSSTTPFPSFA